MITFVANYSKKQQTITITQKGKQQCYNFKVNMHSQHTCRNTILKYNGTIMELFDSIPLLYHYFSCYFIFNTYLFHSNINHNSVKCP